MRDYDVIIVGAGAAGLMCAMEAGKRGRTVLIVDQGKKTAGKIRISGGGRCNFTNIHMHPKDYISENPRFAYSALKRYGVRDFIDLVESYNIAYHEKNLGQLFCDVSSFEIIDMLMDECHDAGVEVMTEVKAENTRKEGDNFIFETSEGSFTCRSLVIATGGPSIPKMGSSGYAYQVAKRYTLNVIAHRAGLVPLTFDAETSEKFKGLAGISQEVEVTTSNPYGGKKAKKTFREALLFTHKGLSGPAVLQISSYWREGNEVIINFTPDIDILEHLKKHRESDPKLGVGTVLSYVLPKRLAAAITADLGLVTKIADMSNKNLERIAGAVNACVVIPNGTEGYKTAEVALGGVDTKEISSKTFEANKVAGLYFIGECLDVTGHLGGFNFQWAWASGHAAGQYV